MGGTSSRVFSRTGRAVVSKPKGSASDPRVTVKMDQAKGLKRQTTEEWADMLKQMSNTISSAEWDGETPVHSTQRHSAERSDRTREKLPARYDAKTKAENSLVMDQHGNVSVPKGRMLHNDMLELFKLRREDAKKWDAAAIAGKYKLEMKDVEDLLKYTRTYLGRLDDDGTMRGYYKPDQDDTIIRFERD